MLSTLGESLHLVYRIFYQIFSLKHGGGNILPDGTMLIMSVTEENVICPQHISGKHLNETTLELSVEP